MLILLGLLGIASACAVVPRPQIKTELEPLYDTDLTLVYDDPVAERCVMVHAFRDGGHDSFECDPEALKQRAAAHQKGSDPNR